MSLIRHLLKIALILGVISLTPPVAAQDGLGDLLQPLLLRYCQMTPGNWRRTVAVLSVMPPERLQRMQVPFQDVDMTQKCAETVRDMMCSAEYLNELGELLKEFYHIPDIDERSLICGAVGGVAGGLAGLAIDQTLKGTIVGGVTVGRGAMALCDRYDTIMSIGGCEKRKADLSRIAGQIRWPEQIESPARFEVEVVQNINRSGLETPEKALLYAEIEARYKILRKLPNTMGDR